jgi:phage-related protein
MPCEGISQFPSVQIPNFDGVVATATDKSFPIPADGYAFNRVGMPSEGISQFPSVQIPNFDGVVPTATDKSFPIWADGDTINLP